MDSGRSARGRPAVVAWTVLAAACLMCAANGARAATVSLEELIAEAQRHNPEIRALAADIDAARGEVTAAGALENPDLSVAPGVRSVRADGGSTREFHGVFELRQTIEFPGKRGLRRALAEKSVELRQLALTGFRNQLTIEVRRTYYTLLASQQALALKEEQLALAGTFGEAARKRVDAGVAPEFETTRADVEFVSAQKAVREARARASATRAALNTLVGRKADAELEIEGALTGDATVPEDTLLVRQALARNPALKVQEAEVERTGLNIESIRKSRLPDFNIGPGIEYLKDEQTYDLGISLPLPLWNGRKGEIAVAEAEQRRALAELEALQREILRGVTSARTSLESARESLALFTPEFFAKLKSSLDATAQGYAEGRTPLLTYLEMKRTYFDARTDYFDTLQTFYDAQAALESALGVPFSGAWQSGPEESK